MSALAKPWENTSQSSAPAPVASEAAAVVPHTGAGVVGASSSSSSTALQTRSMTAEQGSTDGVQQTVPTSSTSDQFNQYTPSYGSGLGYGGLGMGGMGGMYGGLGMGGMYGGLGMGGMYGGLGMGGMYGGLGMGGMYGGLGMYGGPMGMSEGFQRSQMTFMLVGRLLEVCGMFAGVIQMTFGSALQFMSSYIGMSQQYNQLKSGMYLDEHGKWVQVPKRITSARASRNRKFVRSRSQRGGMWSGLLRRLVFLLLAILVVKKFMNWVVVRQHTRIQDYPLACM